jgi:hypothetical protein
MLRAPRCRALAPEVPKETEITEGVTRRSGGTENKGYWSVVSKSNLAQIVLTDGSSPLRLIDY